MSQPNCKFWDGSPTSCKSGSNCAFYHQNFQKPTPLNQQQEVCKFWLQGNCRTGPSCAFLHPQTSNGGSLKSDLCKYWNGSVGMVFVKFFVPSCFFRFPSFLCCLCFLRLVSVFFVCVFFGFLIFLSSFCVSLFGFGFLVFLRSFFWFFFSDSSSSFFC